MVTKLQEPRDPWELESGLPNDVDAYMASTHFGVRDQYMQKVVAGGGESTGLMLLCDLVDEGGEVLGQAGWSVGSGWTADEDGAAISHPTRKNVVASSRYGQLQHRVVKELGVDMNKFGKPLIAKSWDGLGFHWMLEAHDTLKKLEDGTVEKKQGLMPVQFNGVSEAIRGGKILAEAPDKAELAIAPKLNTKLADLAQTNSYKDFVKAAMKIPEVVLNDDLMSLIMDEGPGGYFATHQK